MGKGKILLGVLAAAVGAIALGPRVRVRGEVELPRLPSDLDSYLIGAESQHPELTPGAEKTIIWAGERGVRTDVCLVYLHGFTATRQETSPMADIAARELGANLFYTRLTGHGLPGSELARARAEDWLGDAVEAVAVGQRIGKRVVLIGMSTGGTLATWAAAHPVIRRAVSGLVLLSPNFGPANRFADLLLIPWGRHLADTILGHEQIWQPANEHHGKFWTSRYPTRALIPVMALVRLVRSLPLKEITAPVLMKYSSEDAVVDTRKALESVERFGSEIKEIIDLGDIDDRNDHVLAGDILAPHNTEVLAMRIARFVRDYV